MQFVALAFEIGEECIDAFELAVAIPKEIALDCLQFAVRLGHIESALLERQQHLCLPPFRRRFGPWLDRTRGQTFFPVRNDEILVVSQNIAESLALRAGPERMVEGEKRRPGCAERPAAGLAGMRLNEPATPRSDNLNGADAGTLPERDFDGFCKTAPILLPDDEAVQHDMQVATFRDRQGVGLVCNVHETVTRPDPHEATPYQIRDEDRGTCVLWDGDREHNHRPGALIFLKKSV